MKMGILELITQDTKKFMIYLEKLKAIQMKIIKLSSNGQRLKLVKLDLTSAHGAPFMLQISGSGLIAPCGMLFNERYKR